VKRSEFCGPREPATQRLARLGLTQKPGWEMPKSRFYLARRPGRESDEGWFNKPNPNKTDNEK
jgi:hypothetical protein